MDHNNHDWNIDDLAKLVKSNRWTLGYIAFILTLGIAFQVVNELGVFSK